MSRIAVVLRAASSVVCRRAAPAALRAPAVMRRPVARLSSHAHKEGTTIFEIHDDRTWNPEDVEVERRRLLYRARQTGWLETDILMVRDPRPARLTTVRCMARLSTAAARCLQWLCERSMRRVCANGV